MVVFSKFVLFAPVSAPAMLDIENMEMAKIPKIINVE
jgi:hypothetical protein